MLYQLNSLNLARFFFTRIAFPLFVFTPVGVRALDTIELPWMTGPLLAPAGHTVPPGHTNWEPYLFVNDQYGHYGSNWQAVRTPTELSTTPQLVLTQGLAKRLDFEAIIPYQFNEIEDKSFNSFADIQVMFGIQALEQKPGSWRPDLRVTIGETFPSGNYQRFEPSSLGVDNTGAGSYQTTVAANFQETNQIGNRFLRTRLSLAYTIPSNVKVNGLNAYGGDITTRGTISPGKVFSVDLGFEFTLTQRWVPALDVVYTTSERTTFRGVVGVDDDNIPVQIGSGGAAEFSMAPALEYNFSPAFGVIGGVWFSFEGRDSTEFTAVVLAVNYYV